MKRKSKKASIAIVSVLLILAFGGVLAWGIVNYDKVKNGLQKNNLYTQTDLENSYKDGYSTALKDKEKLLKVIDDYKTNISQKQDMLTAKEAENMELKSQIEGLKNEGLNKDATIAEKEEIIARNNETIKELRSQITKLENSIEEYKALVNSLKASYEVTATFIFDNQVHKVKVVKRGECAGAIENPTSSSSAEFKGWQVNGVDVDPQTYVLEDDTIFIANTTQRHRVDYFANSEIFTTQYVTNNQMPTSVDEPTLFGHNFLGWSLDGVNVVETTTYPITANTTFYAVFEEIKCTITFMVDDTVFNQQIVGYGQGITTPTNPTKTNYNFLCWSTDKTNVAQISPAYLEDTTYFALFEKATLRVYQTSHKNFYCAPFSISWYENNPSKYAAFNAIFDDVYLIGTISNGNVVLKGAVNLLTKQKYATVNEINEGHKTYEFVDNDGNRYRANYKTKFSDVVKTLVLADYNENNCQYLGGDDGIVAWSYYIQNMLEDMTIEINGNYETWPMTIQMNFDCVGYARTSQGPLNVYNSVFGYTPNIYRADYVFNSPETL